MLSVREPRGHLAAGIMCLPQTYPVLYGDSLKE